MAIIIEANYSKKVGLPAYSSHQFSLTLKTELTDITQVQQESAKLYQQLQQGVDASLQQVGWLPEPNGKTNGNGHTSNGNGHTNGHKPKDEVWQCSPKQKELILKIVTENQLDKNEVEILATERFGKGVKQLNKLEASGLIEELMEKYPRQQNRGHHPRYQPASR
jgi:hypothetical protein